MFSRHTSYDIFDYYSSKEDMIEYEYNTLDLYSQKNINCPDPIKISHKKDFSLLFIEYIKSSIKFNRINRFEKQYKRVEYISNLFRDVKQINEYWSHGDLQPDNILRSNGILYYIDPMKVNAFCDFSYIYDVASCIVTACEIERQDIIAEICKTEFQDELLKKVADIIIPVAIQMGQKTSSIGIRKYIR